MNRAEFERLSVGDAVRVLVNGKMMRGEIKGINLQMGRACISLDPESRDNYRAVWRGFGKLEKDN